MNTLDILIKNIPKSPGIYQFFNDKWVIIYIWKSVNLKSRVNSYFNSKSKLNFAKQKMVKQIVDIKTIITNNETESIILETTLIKKHQPKYNILMKDWKNHIYIKITDEIIPKIIKTRHKNSSWTYFWPYISTGYVNNVLKIVKKLFWYRSCNLVFEKLSQIKTSPLTPLLTGEGEKICIKSRWNTKIPCMDYYIKTCSGPCLLDLKSIKEYRENIDNIKLFLKWDNKEIIEKLEIEMYKKAKNLEFEEAEKIRQSIESIKWLDVYQIVREWVIWDFNIINYIEKFDKFYIWMIEIIDSKITWFYNYDIENKLEENKKEILKNFLINTVVSPFLHKDNNIKIPNLIIPFELDLKEEIFNKVKIEIPQIWTKKELLDLCYKNIYEYAYKSHINSLSTKWFTKKTMLNILDLLWFEQVNKKVIFECNDISHISWNYTVASRSIIENWKSDTSKYKKFKIKTLDDLKIDDFGSMKEIIIRRLKEIEKTWIIPDLIVIDGWKWQLSSVVNIIEGEKTKTENKEFLELLNNLQIVSLAKREEELFIAWKSEPIILDKKSSELKLIQKIRDEAHRFAITFNRDSRIKAMKKNILESLPWFWPKTRTKLLKKYWNIDNLSNIPKDELLQTINKNQLETLEDHWII